MYIRLNKLSKSIFVFIAMYATIYMTNAVFNSFLPMYLKSIGFDSSRIGLLLSAPPLIAVVGQLFWGVVGDRSKIKNNILSFLILCSALLIVLFPLSHMFIYIFIVMVVFTFFQSSIVPILDAITLEHVMGKWSFGHIRFAGTVGFALMSILAGIIASKSISNIFKAYCIVAIAALIISLILPKVKGHQTPKNKATMSSLLKNKPLMTKLVFVFFIHMTLGYYYSFFGLYIQELGGSESTIGVASFLSALSETPFLLFSGLILRKFSTNKMLLFAGTFAGIRWLLMGLASTSTMVLMVQPLHGIIFIVLTITMATYINTNVPDELKASGQALNALVLTVAKIISSFIGGFASDALSIKSMFFITSGVAFLTVAVFATVFFKKKSLK